MDAPKLRRPCAVDWDGLPGDGRVRHCSRCGEDVTNISAMAPADAQRFLAANPRACLRFHSDDEGRLVFERPRRRLALAVVATLAACASAQDADELDSPDDAIADAQRGPHRPFDDDGDADATVVDDPARPDTSKADDTAMPTQVPVDPPREPPSIATDEERAPLEHRDIEYAPPTRAELRWMRSRPRYTRSWTGR